MQTMNSQCVSCVHKMHGIYHLVHVNSNTGVSGTSEHTLQYEEIKHTLMHLIEETIKCVHVCKD